MRRLLSRDAQRGQAIVLIAAMMTVLLGFVALAIDSARAFETRRLLQDSVDAAALYAADSYDSGATWNASVLNGANLFTQDLHLYGSVSCPAATTPTLGSITAVSVSCSVPSPATLTVYISDQGPAGQTFTYSATYPMTVAIMQVLGVSPNITVSAQGTAATGDGAWSPALTTLSGNGCYGAGGNSLTVTSSNPVAVFGNLFTNGSASVDASSALQVAGVYDGACATSTPTAPTYECWPSTPPTMTAQPCTAGSNVAGSAQLTSRFNDPGYTAPNTGALSAQTWPGSPTYGVVAQPGIYSAAVTVAALPNGLNNYPCYFMAPGIYNFTNGFTINAGLVSNRLSAPDARIHHGQQTNYPIWDDNKNAKCTGGVAVNSPTPSASGVPIGTWGFEVTSYRSDTYNGITYYRESAPGACHSVSVVVPNDAIPIVISNQPGAQGYNIYAVKNPSSCSPTSTPPANNNFGFVKSVPINATTTTGSYCPGGQGAPNYCQSNSITSGCPYTGSNPSGSNCALAQVSTTIDGSATGLFPAWAVNNSAPRQASGGPMPDDMGLIYQSAFGLPSEDPAVGDPTQAYAVDVWGDLGNTNFCATATNTSGVKCPSSWGSAYVTPGGVQLYFTNNSCLTLSASGDMYVFGGFQYEWLTVYEPAATTCSNSLGGKFFSAIVGSIYAPGASLTISGSQQYGPNGDPYALNRSELTPWLGGIDVKTATINGAPHVSLVYNEMYAPPVGGSRLTG